MQTQPKHSPSYLPPPPASKGSRRPVRRIRVGQPGRSVPPPIPADARRRVADPPVPKTIVSPPPVATIEHLGARTEPVARHEGPCPSASWDEPTWQEGQSRLLLLKVRLRLRAIRLLSATKRLREQLNRENAITFMHRVKDLFTRENRAAAWREIRRRKNTALAAIAVALRAAADRVAARLPS